MISGCKGRQLHCIPKRLSYSLEDARYYADIVFNSNLSKDADNLNGYHTKMGILVNKITSPPDTCSWGNEIASRAGEDCIEEDKIAYITILS